MWDQSGSSLRGWALLWDDVNQGTTKYESVAAELRAIEDRHGLTAKAMLQLRWVFADPADDYDPVVDGRPEKRTPDSPAMAAIRAAREHNTITPEQRAAVRERLMAEAMAESGRTA